MNVCINYRCERRGAANLNDETKSFYILLVFLLTTIELLIAVSIYCYLIKYKEIKHLLPFYVTNNELKEILY